MKLIKTPLATAVCLSMISLLISGCGKTQQEDSSSSEHEHGGGHGHHGDEASAEEGHGGGGEHSHAGGGHMDHMNDVKEWLQKELGDKYDKPVPPASAEQLVQGKAVYLKICFTCHGVSGKGDGLAAAALPQKPADFTDSAHSKFYSDQGRIHIIKKGVENTPMVAWEAALSKEEILAVYGYVVSLRSPDSAAGHGAKGGKFVCPMHKDVSSDKAGKCSKCGMALKESDHGTHKH